MLAVLTTGLLLAVAGCSSNGREPEPDVVVDLLRQNWQHVPGVTVEDGGLHVTAAARQIVEQDGE